MDTENLKALALAATPEHEFTDDERRLYELMSEISEDCWCAGWMHGNEFSLWEAISTGNLRYGMGEMDRDLLAQVAALSVKTGKWIIWRDDQDGLDPHDVSEWGPYAVSLKDWTDRCSDRDQMKQERDELRAELERLRAVMKQAAIGYESGFFSSTPSDLEGRFVLHYGTPQEAEGAFFALTTAIEAELPSRCRAAGGNTNENMVVSKQAKNDAKTAETRMDSGFAGGGQVSAPAAGTDQARKPA
jgi:hypothetical protein